MSVKKQAPPSQTTNPSEYDELIETAFAEPGEWFSMPMGSRDRSNTYSTVYRGIGTRVAELSVRDDTIYLRVKP